ncbi:MAG: hypothetical protein IPK16_25525, partial [Anaerolineales bacterium]|nr:hypothetical protein [Anaerolineales bacterium]
MVLTDNRQKPDEIVLEIARWLADQLQTTTARDAEMSELGYWLPRDVGARPDRLLVLFIDS